MPARRILSIWFPRPGAGRLMRRRATRTRAAKRGARHQAPTPAHLLTIAPPGLVLTTRGEWLWLYQAHGAAFSGGWFCHGRFA
ncbi:MAG: hypothetical protein IBX58_11505 [Roseovarius sp.]|nr:hypothetical protein [Roseovarius sp.]